MFPEPGQAQHISLRLVMPIVSTIPSKVERDVTTVALMQPYLLPYLGYFHLMSAVDRFIIHDDVQYIKGGWINRNRFLRDGEPVIFTLPVRQGGHNRLISESHYADQLPEALSRILRQFDAAYRGSDHYRAVVTFLRGVAPLGERSVVTFNAFMLRVLAKTFGLRASFSLSSELGIDPRSRGQDRVIEICRRVGADCYLNPLGGRDLYDREAFARAGLHLGFIESTFLQYPQASNSFVPALSIVDVLFGVGLEGMGPHLASYRTTDEPADK